MKKVKLIIITLILCIVAFLIGYYVRLSLDKWKGGEDVNVKVVYEDSEIFTIPSIKKMSKKEALEEWPFIVHIENTGKDKGLYQIIIKAEDKSISTDNLEYVLMENDKEIKSDSLKNIKNDILLESEINGKEKKEYKLYIYSNKDYEEGNFSYKLTFNVIKSGGPGF